MGGWEWGKWVKLGKRYKLPVISPGYTMYSMVTTVNNTVIYVGKLLRE